MTHFSTFGRLSTAKLALLLSAIGFSFALATSQSPQALASADAEALVGPRVLGTNAVRRSVQFLTSSDLGVVVVGSQFTRQILVQYGFRPHVFSIGNQQPTSDSLTLTNQGKLSGNEPDPITDIFDIVVTDKPSGRPLTPVTRKFGLLSVDQVYGSPLHFATAVPPTVAFPEQNVTLPVALTGESYYFTLQANGGHPPYTFEILEQTGGRFLPQGLAFDAKKSNIFGKPVTPTLAGKPNQIDVLLTDSAGGQIKGHLFLTVVQGTISSQAVATQGSMGLRFGNSDGRDTLSFTLLLDKSSLNSAGIRSAADLKDLPFEMNFGGYTLPPDARPKSTTKIIRVFDQNGKITVPRKKLVQGDVVGSLFTDVEYTISLDPVKGILKATFKNLQMIRAIGANFLSFEGQSDPTNRGPVIPINIKLGLKAAATVDAATSVLERTDLIKFVYKRKDNVAKGTASLNDNIAPAGVFLINKVSGIEQQVVTDKFNNVKEDRIFLQMTGIMRQPGAKPVVPLNGDSVDVFINQLNLGTFPANSFAVKGDTLSFSNDDQSKGLKDLIIDNKSGKVTINTWGLDPNNKLFGVDILIAGEPQEVPITLTIGGNNTIPTFDGQSTVTLFRFKVGIKNK